MTVSPVQLKALRQMRNLTKSDIASIVCRSTSTISQWESGRRQIDDALWQLILLKTKATEREINNFLSGDGLPIIESKKEDLISFNDFKKNLPELMRSTHQKEIKNCSKNDVKFIDLFAGIGGIRTAFESAGAKCVFSSEINIFAQYTYYANHGTVPFGDITKITAEEIPNHDILCAGFPCQPFSHIGKREGFKHPTQGTMFYEIVRILKVKKPKAVFLENVPGLINHDHGNTLKIIIESLEEIGYHCTYTVLNAKDFGVPQSRARFYLVGLLENKEFQFPDPPMEKANIGDYLEKNVSGYEISEHLQKTYLFKKDDGRPVLIDQNTKGPTKTLVCSYHKIQRLTGTFVKDGPTGVRLLTERECKAIMGFPNDFIIPVSRTQMYRQMGNSVVVKVIEAIAKNLVPLLQTK